MYRLNYKEILKETSFFIVIGLISSLLSAYIIDIFYYNFNFEHVHNVILDGRPELFLLGVAILFIFYVLLSSSFGSIVIAGIVLMLFSTLTGIATYFKIDLRAEPIYPSEITMVNQMGFLLEMIGLRNVLVISAFLASIIFGLVLIYIKLLKPKPFSFSNLTYYSLRIVGAVVSGSLIFYITQFNTPGNHVRAIYDEHASWVTYNQMRNYSENGFIAGFLFNLSAPPMDPIEDYNRSTIEEIVEYYSTEADQINASRTPEEEPTNVIFIMNESLSDPFNLEGLEANGDPIPYHREVEDISLHGTSLSPSFGGGTANSEFQAITTMSLEPFAPHITSTFVQLTNAMMDMPSLPSRYLEQGYNTTAIHPYTPMFYKRNEVYRNLEFETFLHEDNMTHQGSLSEQHRYISDEEAYREVLSVIDETENPDFIHLVTMQNHTPFANKYDEVQFETTGSGNDSESNAYFEDLYHSELALEFLIEEIDNHEEPILFAYWGDHLPGFYEGEILEENPLHVIRETPLLFYSNRHELNEELGIISPIFFINHVNSILNTPVSPYDALLMELEEHIPAMENGLYYDVETDTFVDHSNELSEEAQQLLDVYTAIQYDITTGNQYAEELNFFDVPNN